LSFALRAVIGSHLLRVICPAGVIYCHWLSTIECRKSEDRRRKTEVRSPKQ